MAGNPWCPECNRVTNGDCGNHDHSGMTETRTDQPFFETVIGMPPPCSSCSAKDATISAKDRDRERLGHRIAELVDDVALLRRDKDATIERLRKERDSAKETAEWHTKAGDCDQKLLLEESLKRNALKANLDAVRVRLREAWADPDGVVFLEFVEELLALLALLDATEEETP